MGETITDQLGNKSNCHTHNRNTGYPGLKEIINQGTWYLVFTDNREARANADNFLLSGCVTKSILSNQISNRCPKKLSA